MVSAESDEGDRSPLYLMLITEGAVPPIGLMGEPLGGDLISAAPPFFRLGDSCFNRGGEGLLSNDSSLGKPRYGVPGVEGG